MSTADRREHAVLLTKDNKSLQELYEHIKTTVLEKDLKLVVFANMIPVYYDASDFLEALDVPFAALPPPRGMPGLEENVNSFRDPKGPKVILATAAAAEGSLNFDVAWHMVFLDDIDPDLYKRCEGTVVRYGQTESAEIVLIRSGEDEEYED